MNYPQVVISNRKEEFISIQRVDIDKRSSLTHIRLTFLRMYLLYLCCLYVDYLYPSSDPVYIKSETPVRGLVNQ